MAYKRICANCKVKFVTTDKKVINCSRKCKGEYQFKNTIKRIEKENNICDLKNWLTQKYSREQQTFRWIFNYLNINNRTVSKLLNYYKIPIRYGSEAIKAQWATKEKQDARRKPNEYIIRENCAEIKVYRRTKNRYDTVLIDLEDVEKCKKYHWTISCGYVSYGYSENKKDITIKLYRYILSVPDDKLIDHINGDPLDNRKCNLRICTKLENAWNRATNKDSKTGVKGVHYTSSGKFEAGITYKNERIYLGTFYNKQEAVEARRKAELKYFGEYSYLNRNKVLVAK